MAAARLSAKKPWATVLVVVALVMFEACDGGPEEKRFYEGVVLEKGIYYASARRWKDHGLEWLVQDGSDIKLRRDIPGAEGLGKASEITILIHGYHAPDRTIVTYFRGLIEQLREIGGYRNPIVVFDWPSAARHWVEISIEERMAFIELSGARKPDLSWEIANYNADRENVRSIGIDALVALLSFLRAERPDRRFNLVAHSMGCYLVFGALKRPPKELAGIANVFWLAPDLDSDVLRDPAFGAGLAGVGRLHIYFSRHDGVLGKLSKMLHWSSMLGADGPDTAHALPGNVTIHDMTDGLGEQDVHSRHLEAGSATAVSVTAVLEAPD